ncbi:MAG: hypothetical protein C4583_18825 [Anaerolineaceae bacterium]|nr:MAG: hypothetical protein C4583_18825 [Anaerolineaceae bacterium]
MEDGARPVVEFVFELAEVIPKFDASVALRFPVFPGDVGFAEERSGGLVRMGKEADAARLAYRVDERLRVVCEGGEVAVRAEDEQVVFLRVARLIVDFLPDEH